MLRERRTADVLVGAANLLDFLSDEDVGGTGRGALNEGHRHPHHIENVTALPLGGGMVDTWMLFFTTY